MAGAIRIHYYVHGRGRGHATRAQAVIARLREAGCRVSVFAGRDAEAVLRAPGVADEVHAVRSLLPGDGVRAAGLVPRRVAQAVAALRRAPADVVVSDGDLPGLLAAQLCRVPAVAVGHGLVFSHCQRPAELPRQAWQREARKARLSSLGSSRQVAVNFVPLQARGATTVVARPLLRPGLGPRDQDAAREGEVLCYFRDDNGAEAVRALLAAGARVQLFGRRDPGIAGARFVPLDPERFAEALPRARAVVSSAGSQLIAECVALGVPQFALYRADDDEQALNVAMLRHAGVGDGCDFGSLTAEQIERFLRHPPAPRQRADWPAPEVASAVWEQVRQLT
ncbi:glycosyltransferase family protein [Haliangium ochraceum]|uniref:Glycosyltransferase n=1 Tax=Haliangium ochraceum (strain DSM 14365 / JCM 11303 / SMP-2) TaxID=502025 RepID=D0LSJ6_HALO1|nr:glycosyltransferase family protein [Haliangium ochraceum]ACY15695.1 conserved hypothetical protein [Haliangium ochraceum DSM 14365]